MLNLTSSSNEASGNYVVLEVLISVDTSNARNCRNSDAAGKIAWR